MDVELHFWQTRLFVVAATAESGKLHDELSSLLRTMTQDEIREELALLHAAFRITIAATIGDQATNRLQAILLSANPNFDDLPEDELSSCAQQFVHWLYNGYLPKHAQSLEQTALWQLAQKVQRNGQGEINTVVEAMATDTLRQELHVLQDNYHLSAIAVLKGNSDMAEQLDAAMGQIDTMSHEELVTFATVFVKWIATFFVANRKRVFRPKR